MNNVVRQVRQLDLQTLAACKRCCTLCNTTSGVAQLAVRCVSANRHHDMQKPKAQGNSLACLLKAWSIWENRVNFQRDMLLKVKVSGTSVTVSFMGTR